MLEIEFKKPELMGTSPETGEDIYQLTRMVSNRMAAYGVCHILLTENDPERQLEIAISLGEWWLDDVAFRRCFSVCYNASPQQPGFTIVDPEPEIWQEITNLGRFLTCQQALADPEIDLLWEILHRLFTDDPIIGPYVTRQVSG